MVSVNIIPDDGIIIYQNPNNPAFPSIMVEYNIYDKASVIGIADGMCLFSPKFTEPQMRQFVNSIFDSTYHEINEYGNPVFTEATINRIHATRDTFSPEPIMVKMHPNPPEHP